MGTLVGIFFIFLFLGGMFAGGCWLGSRIGDGIKRTFVASTGRHRQASASGVCNCKSHRH